MKSFCQKCSFITTLTVPLNKKRILQKLLRNIHLQNKCHLGQEIWNYLFQKFPFCHRGFLNRHGSLVSFLCKILFIPRGERADGNRIKSNFPKSDTTGSRVISPPPSRPYPPMDACPPHHENA